MVNWKEYNYPFKKFTEEITQEWMNCGFNKKETREWLESGLQSNDFRFAQWLRDDKGIDVEWFADRGSEEDLRKEFQNCYLGIGTSLGNQKGWQFIHPDFTLKLQEKWKKKGFNYKECEKWINSGLLPTDADYALWLINIKKIGAEQLVFNGEREKLKGEYWQSKISSKQLEITLLLKKMSEQEIEFNTQGLINKKNDKKFIQQIKNKKNEPISISETLKLLEIIEKNKDIYIWKCIVLETIEELQKEWKEKESYEGNDACGSIGMKLNDTNHTDHPQWLKKSGGLSFSSFETYRIDEKLKKQHQEIKQCQKLIKLLLAMEDETLPLLNVDDSKLTVEVIDAVKVFSPYSIMNFRIKVIIEQMQLIERLMPNKELRKRYKKYGLCSECDQPKTYNDWCQSCEILRFQRKFKSWTSGNPEIDKFIQDHQIKATSWKGSLEWIPYCQLTDIEYLAEGGFAKVYKAKLKKRLEVALKVLHNSQNTTADFLQEITYNKFFEKYEGKLVQFYGISRDPETKNFIIVMNYMKGGDLRQFLQINYDKLEIWDKIERINSIAAGLKDIHEKGLIHRDFHPGNILVDEGGYTHIADLGLCRPANEINDRKVYGILPYVAPEVLRGQPYTQTSDVYSFGMVVYEVLSGKPPYHNMPYNYLLAIKICQGLRPDLDKIKIPQLLRDLIIKCWNAEPLNRPKTAEIESIFNSWIDGGGYVMIKDTKFNRQVQEIEGKSYPLFFKLNKETYQKMHPRAFSPKSYIMSNVNKRTVVKTHPQAIYASRLLDFKNLPEPQNSKDMNEQFWNSQQNNFISQSVEFDLEALDNCLKEQMEQENIVNQNQDWQSHHFTPDLASQWGTCNFSPSQTQDWVNIGLQPTGYSFCAWLRDEVKITPLELLNDSSRIEDLQEQFKEYQQLETKIEVPSKDNQ